MKIGIISDVHSNIDALKTIFDEFEKRKIDKILCLGDSIGLGPYPKEAMDFLIDRKDMFVGYIRGNHENYLLNGIPLRAHNDPNDRILSDEEIGTHKWNHSNLTEDQIKFISKIPIRDVIELNGKKIVLEHYPMDKNNKFKKFHKIPTVQELKESFEIKDADIYLFGHTHVSLYYEDNGQYYINPGSLGCPIGTDAACAGILTIENNEISYEQLKLKYDIEKVIEDIKKKKYPANWLMIKIFYRNS